jgi:hypothetical protein
MKARPVELSSRMGKDFLVFRRIVPARDRRLVGEFEDDDPFRLRSAFYQFGRAAPCQEAAAILFERGADRGLGQGSIPPWLVISFSPTK